MASKVLVPSAPFAKLQVKKSLPEPSGSGFIVNSTDAVARVAHLEHSVRFLQEQHRLMLSGLHAEIEALRERNRDLQFQLIFNKESSPSPKAISLTEDNIENSEENQLRREVARLGREAAAARGEARAAEARALQLQRMFDAQQLKMRELEVKATPMAMGARCGAEAQGVGVADGAEGAESRAELRVKLAEAERLVRRLRADADRQRREVLRAAPLAGVTNLLFDGAANRHAHLQCMKKSLQASLRATGIEPGFGYQNNYHFPPAPDFWREPLADEYCTGGRRTRRPLPLPELAASGHQIHRATVYANNHARSRPNGYDSKNKKPLAANGETIPGNTTDEPTERPRLKTICTTDLAKNCDRLCKDSAATYPELKVVVTRLISQEHVNTVAGAAEGSTRARPKRHHHRKHAPDHT